MAYLYYFLLFVFVLNAFLLILLVLMQSDKGGGLAGNLGALGSGINNMLGGGTTGNFLTKLTTWMAVLFMVLCISLNVLSSKRFMSTEYKSRVGEAIQEKKDENAPSSILPAPLRGNNLPSGGTNIPAPQPSSPTPKESE
ncbi:MAG: preprotein translocase subunit SecG [Fibrobacterota bacterium]